MPVAVELSFTSKVQMSRDANDRVTISYRCSERLRARIEEAAERDGLNLTQEITKCIEYGLSEEERSIFNSPLLRMQAQGVKQCENISGMKWFEDQETGSRVREMLIGIIDLTIPLQKIKSTDESRDIRQSIEIVEIALRAIRQTPGEEASKLLDNLEGSIKKMKKRVDDHLGGN